MKVVAAPYLVALNVNLQNTPAVFLYGCAVEQHLTVPVRVVVCSSNTLRSYTYIPSRTLFMFKL